MRAYLVHAQVDIPDSFGDTMDEVIATLESHFDSVAHMVAELGIDAHVCICASDQELSTGSNGVKIWDPQGRTGRK